MNALRYVILRHDGIDQPHFDLMFETAPGSPLTTWRASAWPPTAQLVLERLPDHRPLYLTFEGNLSGNRGQIHRVEEGHCTIICDRDNSWTIHIDPQSGNKKLSLQINQDSDSSWLCTPQ